MWTGHGSQWFPLPPARPTPLPSRYHSITWLSDKGSVACDSINLVLDFAKQYIAKHDVASVPCDNSIQNLFAFINSLLKTAFSDYQCGISVRDLLPLHGGKHPHHHHRLLLPHPPQDPLQHPPYTGDSSSPILHLLFIKWSYFQLSIVGLVESVFNISLSTAYLITHPWSMGW